jgi:Mg2+ and Co2+ transporter CorA
VGRSHAATWFFIIALTVAAIAMLAYLVSSGRLRL